MHIAACYGAACWLWAWVVQLQWLRMPFTSRRNAVLLSRQSLRLLT